MKSCNVAADFLGEKEGMTMGHGYKFRNWYIPDHMMGAIRRYIDDGIPPGSFLSAIIDNDLKEAVGRADDENLANLPAYVGYFYNEAPVLCWGSPAHRHAWIEQKMSARLGSCEGAAP